MRPNLKVVRCQTFDRTLLRPFGILRKRLLMPLYVLREIFRYWFVEKRPLTNHDFNKHFGRFRHFCNYKFLTTVKRVDIGQCKRSGDSVASLSYRKPSFTRVKCSQGPYPDQRYFQVQKSRTANIPHIFTDKCAFYAESMRAIPFASFRLIKHTSECMIRKSIGVLRFGPFA